MGGHGTQSWTKATAAWWCATSLCLIALSASTSRVHEAALPDETERELPGGLRPDLIDIVIDIVIDIDLPRSGACGVTLSRSAHDAR